MSANTKLKCAFKLGFSSCSKLNIKNKGHHLIQLSIKMHFHDFDYKCLKIATQHWTMAIFEIGNVFDYIFNTKCLLIKLSKFKQFLCLKTLLDITVIVFNVWCDLFKMFNTVKSSNKVVLTKPNEVYPRAFPSKINKHL